MLSGVGIQETTTLRTTAKEMFVAFVAFLLKAAVHHAKCPETIVR